MDYFKAFLGSGVLLALLSVKAWGVLPKIQLEPISEKQIVAPVGITNAGDGSNRLFVTDQRGKIHILQNGALLPNPFLDLGSLLVPERTGFDERGLLGLAFHPNFGQATGAGNDKFYVYYTAPRPGGDPADPVNPINSQSVVAEFSVPSQGSNVANSASQRILMTFDKPQFNHNGGFLGFGPDNQLYITTGDGGGGGDNEPGHTGGGAGDPTGGLGNSQDRTNLLGKVLRIDPFGTNGSTGQYGIPADNPFVGVGNGVREEIYAYGLRNPWRATFDRDRLIVADVGQGDVEEINLIQKGGNYGWRIKEGNLDFDNTVTPNPATTLIGPIAEYAHPNSTKAPDSLLDVGLSVTGGVVYRGTKNPDLQGAYIFGDWSTGFQVPSGTLLGMEETTPGSFKLSVLDVVGGNPIGKYIQAFGADESGEIYVATRTTLAPSALGADQLPTGGIYRINQVIPEPAFVGLLFPLLWVLGTIRRTRSV